MLEVAGDSIFLPTDSASVATAAVEQQQPTMEERDCRWLLILAIIFIIYGENALC